MRASLVVVGVLAVWISSGCSERAAGSPDEEVRGSDGDGSSADGDGDGSSGDAGPREDGGLPPDRGCSGGAAFDLGALQATVQYLASDELGGRAPGTPGDLAARAYIEERFHCLGLNSAGSDGSFQQPFVTSSGQDTANVVGWLPGIDPSVGSEIVLVGAHHDHLGASGGQIFSGANDNASGVAAMLAMAHAFVQRGAATRRTVAFVAFGYEEHDGECEGSEHYVAHPPAALPMDRVVYMVDTDMVGVYPIEESLTAYGSFSGTSGRALLEELAGGHPGLNLALDLAADEDASDFQAFCDVGIPYVYFETWDEPCWHKPCDKADRIDYPSLGEVATLAFELTLGLADTEAQLTGSCAPR